MQHLWQRGTMSNDPLIPIGEPAVAPAAPRAAWIAMAGAGLLAVLLLGFSILDDVPLAWDRAIILALRVPGDTRQPIGPDWLHQAMVDITALGSGTVLTLAVVVAVGLLLVRRLWLTAALVLAATVTGSLLAAQAKFFFHRTRPELVDHLVPVTGLSFPSGHATNSAIVYLTLAGLLAQVERGHRARSYTSAVAILLVGAIGVSRVYLGVHWPSDVVAGWCAGTGWAALWWWLGATARTSLARRRQ
ncbi:phosphatase PAP2 family protein [Sphingomonas adhaesiva]|uniref:phosphatase PAP2 family protein n=1 Tax=Sphingomonas adhaesiva TaxID=28212 RepID=UPI002FF5C7D2